MDHIDLTEKEAVNKLRELTQHAGIGFLQTHLDHVPSNGRPMLIVFTDEEGRLWFFSKSHSRKNAEILANNKVQVICSRPRSAEYFQLYGEAVIVNDRKKMRDLWVPALRPWFSGADDPDITLICVTPLEAYYWDSKHTSAALLFKQVIGVLTGINLNGEVEGELKLTNRE